MWVWIVLLILLVIGLIGLGVMMIVNGVKERRKSTASREWPEVQGRITLSQVGETRVPGPNDRYYTQVTPTIHYAYSGEWIKRGLIIWISRF